MPRSLPRPRLLLSCGLLLYLILSTCILLSHTPNKTGGRCRGLPAIFCALGEDTQSEALKALTSFSKTRNQDDTLNDFNQLKPYAGDQPESGKFLEDEQQSDLRNEGTGQGKDPGSHFRLDVAKRKVSASSVVVKDSSVVVKDSSLLVKDSDLVVKDSALPKKVSDAVANNSSASVRPFPPLYQPVLKDGVNCRKLWQGDDAEVERALKKHHGKSALPAARRPAGFYQSITSDCRRYREQAGYIESITAEEREFPLAFSLMVYQEVEQVERLLRAVYRPHNVYCLHLDLKAPPQLVQDLQSLTRCLPNVVWSEGRLDVRWGHFSVLHMELLCMERLWRQAVAWRYLINLTGQEFPLKTNKELVKILQAYRGANDILGEKPKERNKWRWKKAGNPPHNISVAKGPVHVAASRGFVDFALHSKQAKDFLAWTKKTGIPDETFFATLNNMHQFGVPGSYTGSLTGKRRIMLNRFKIWDVTNRTCSGRFVRHICHFGPQEVALLARSRHLVANKFTYDLHPLAWDCTEQWYFQRVRKEEETGRVDVNTEPYRKLLIVQHALRPEDSPWG